MIRFFMIALLLLASTPALAGWSRAIDDLPLMAGMRETGEPVIFDKPGGRIVETSAATQATPEQVARFYQDALPPLGWVPRGKDYARGGEVLSIDAKTNIVRFILTPEEK